MQNRDNCRKLAPAKAIKHYTVHEFPGIPTGVLRCVCKFILFLHEHFIIIFSRCIFGSRTFAIRFFFVTDNRYIRCFHRISPQNERVRNVSARATNTSPAVSVIRPAAVKIYEEMQTFYC